MRNRTPAAALSLLSCFLFASAAHAQKHSLPDAPATHLFAQLVQDAPPTQAPLAMPAPPRTPANINNALPPGPTLTIDQAEQIALKNNPNVSIGRLLALALGQVTRQARAIEMPQVDADLTAVDAHRGSRITGAGTINSPLILNKAAGGLAVSQLITDFGHTHNLVKSAQSNARAQLESERATELDIRLAVDQVFYQALTSQAVFKVAEQTVAQRQATGDQIGALTKSQVKSELDLSFANVQISQANLLLLDARSNEQASMAALNNILGSEQDQQYVLVDETSGNPTPAPDDAEALVQTAFKQRPDLASLNEKFLSAKQYTTAEHDLWMPTISALLAGGGTPVRDDQIQSSWYLGAGANMNIAVFNGFLYSADEKEARYRASAAGEQVRNLRDTIARDVRTAVLNAQTAFQRIGVTQDMLNQANFSLDLATARYKIGLSSIVELTQAQLNQTEAQIENTNARYAYQTALAEVRYETGQ